MSRNASIAAYLASSAAAVILLNANSGNDGLAIAIWAIASVLLGWGTGQLGFALLPFLSIPFAVPFGYPNHYEFSEPLAIWWSALIFSFLSAILIAVAATIRLIVDARRRPRISS